MNKEELLKLKRKIISYGGAGIIALTSLTGCSDPIPNQTVSQSIEDDSYDLAHDNSKKIITVKYQNNTKNIYLVDKKTMADLQIYSDSKKYDKYLSLSKAHANNTFIYIDVFTLDVVAVKYINENNESYFLNEVVNEEPAIDYASKNIGLKNKYTKEELNNMTISLRRNLMKEQYLKK